MLGEPRTHCPYCRRELPRGPTSEPLAAELVEAAPAAVRIHSEPTAPSTLEELIRKKDVLRREVTAQTQSRLWRIVPDALPQEESFPDTAASGATATVPKRQQCFLDPAATTLALREVQQSLEQHLARRTKQACQGCELATCELAFRCGALPRDGHGAAYVFGWTLVPALLSLIPTAAIVLPVWYLASLGSEPSYRTLALCLLGVPLAIGGTIFLYTCFASRWRRAHWRALAAAAKELELRFSTLKVAAGTASAAIPVLCPGASAATRPAAEMSSTCKSSSPARARDRTSWSPGTSFALPWQTTSLAAFCGPRRSCSGRSSFWHGSGSGRCGAAICSPCFPSGSLASLTSRSAVL